MYQELQTKADEKNNRRRNKRRWYHVVSALACVVTFCTVYAMILPAITLESSERELSCQFDVHHHSEECLDDAGNRICGKVEYAVHTHDSGCYDAEGILVCHLPEVKAHAHDDECFSVTAELICEQEVHSHETACYTEPETIPTEAAREETLPEGETGPEEETQPTAPAPVLTCTKTEHSHGEGCYEKTKELICEKDEIVLHTHSTPCYEGDDLICGRLEIREHIHSDACFVALANEDEEPEGTTEATDSTTEATEETTEATTENTASTESTKPGVVKSTGPAKSIPVVADATVVASGTCGSPNAADVTWTLTDDGVLTISGTGKMADYGSSTMPWYSNRTSVQSVVIKEGVTSIGKYVFYNHTNLTEISIPAGVTAIGTSAFSGCSSLTGITIPAGVTTISNTLFYNCKALTSIDLPDGVISIGENAFSDCSSLSSIELPSGVTSIGSYAFDGCSSLASISIPDSVTTIGSSAFSNCSRLTGISIPEGVTTISNTLFYNCKALTSIGLPDGVTSIGNGAFRNCSRLTGISIPEGVTAIASDTFNGCSGLTDIDLPDSLDSIGERAFAGCTGLTSIEIPKSVTTIGKSAFGTCHNLKEMILNNGAVSGSSWGPGQLQSLTIGAEADVLDAAVLTTLKNGSTSFSELRFVGPNHFRYTGTDFAVDKLVLTAGEYYIDEHGIVYLLHADGTAKLVYVPETLALESFVVPQTVPSESGSCSVTAIGNRAFHGCSRLTAVSLPDGITQIGHDAFALCTNLADVNGATTLAEVLARWKSAGADTSTFRDTALWKESADGAFKITADPIEKEDNTGRKITLRIADDHSLLTGEGVQSTLHIEKGDAKSDCYVRVYFQFDDAHGSINYSLGPNSFEGIGAVVCESAVPNTYYIQIDPLLAGQTLSLNIYSTYANVVSGGGKALIWMEILTQEKAEALGNGVTVPEDVHMPTWRTSPDPFPVTKTANNASVTIAADVDDPNMVYLGNFQFSVAMSHSGDTLAYGKDYVKSVEFVDSMTLPEPFCWNEHVIAAVRAGQWRTTYSNAGKTVTYYVTIGDVEYKIAEMNGDKISQYSIQDAALRVGESGALQIVWTYMNKSATNEIPNFTGTVKINSPAIEADADAVAEQYEQSESALSFDFQNDISARKHYTHSDDQITDASAVKTISVGASDYTIDKTQITSTTMGTAGSYSITLKNNQVLPYTQLDYLSDPLKDWFYISPADLETMFFEDTFGKYLSVTITPATLYQTVTDTVTGTDGNSYSIIQQLQGVDTPHAGKATQDTGIITQEAVLELKWSEDQDHLLLAVGNEAVYTIGLGQQYAHIQDALDAIGYYVTQKVCYNCIWDLSKQVLYGGTTFQFPVRSSIKDTFMRLTGDADWYLQSTLEIGRVLNNTAYAYEKDGTYKSKNTFASAYRDFTLFKKAYLNDELIDGTSQLESGNVIIYRNEVAHRERASYKILPLIDSMTGAQALLVSVQENPALAAMDLETMAVSGKDYYILNEVGTYQNVQVGNYLADRVEVSRSDAGLNTLICWYLADVAGTKTIAVEYLALVSPEKSGLIATGNTFALSNEVWLNDHQTHRLYDSVGLHGSLLRMDKKIVTNLDEEDLTDLSAHDDARDELSVHTIVHSGEKVTYRLMLEPIGDGAVTVQGSGIFDELPASLEGYWTKDNIRVVYLPAGGSSAQVTNGDSWRIDTDPDDANQQILCWNDDFSVSINGTFYIYVTLTFPEGTGWTAYGEAYGAQELWNTFHVYQQEAAVSHILSVSARALLQKNVQLTGVGYYRGDTEYQYQHFSGEDALWYYANDGQGRGIVTYSVVLYNSGDAKLYLSDIQDVLPQGFTILSLYMDKNIVSYESGNSVLARSNASYNANLLSVGDNSVTYKKAYVAVSTGNNGNGQQTLTFSLSNFDENSTDGNLSYDEILGKYYLMPGEAVVFAYNCATNDYQDAQDVALNTVAMPCYDYNEAGVTLDTHSAADRKYPGSQKSNNGSRSLLTNGQAELFGMNTAGWSSDDQWLISQVDVRRGSIMPGITKSAEKPFAHVTDLITWNVELSNSGTEDMRDYTVTDVMMAPYQFGGTVAYRVGYDDRAEGTAYTNNLFTFNSRSENDSVVTIRSSRGSAELTVNGDYQPLQTTVTIDEWKATGGSTSYFVTIQVRLSRDNQGNEMLSILFPYDTAEKLVIPADGRGVLTLQTKYYGTDYKNATYFNTAYLIPSDEQSFDTGAVSQGNYTIFEEQDALVSEANVAVSYGYATASDKSVVQLTDPDNNAASVGSQNYIVLTEVNDLFRYTLGVKNTGGDSESEAMDLLVLIDNLPQENDHVTFYADIPRYSNFRVNFADAENLGFAVAVNGTALAENVYSVEFSEKTVFDDSDWNGTGTAGWYTLSNLPSGLALRDMRAVRVVIRDDTGAVIPADAEITASFNAQVDAAGAVPEASQVAWNSFGYHYSLVGKDTELEAAPQKVGVKMPSVPMLVKQVTDSDGNVYCVEADTAFRFLIYEGEAVSIPDQISEATVGEALGQRKFTVVNLTVPTGKSASELMSLEDLYCYELSDGQFVQTEEPWTWKNLSRYTLLELPPENEKYSFGAINTNQSNNFTFSYKAASVRTLTCTNIRQIWTLQLSKLSQDTGARLPGAVFGLYSPRLRDQIGENDHTAQLRIEKDGATWYLMDIRTTDENGWIVWNGLTEAQYYLVELQAPEGYILGENPSYVVRENGGATVNITVTNLAAYELPETGGMGTGVYRVLGMCLTASALVLGCSRKRRRKGA